MVVKFGYYLKYTYVILVKYFIYETVILITSN